MKLEDIPSSSSARGVFVVRLVVQGLPTFGHPTWRDVQQRRRFESPL